MKTSWLACWIAAPCLMGQASAAAPCANSGSALANCAASWQIIFEKQFLDDLGSAYEAGYFGAFVLGIALTGNGWFFCPRLPFTEDQLSATVAKYLRANPEQWGSQPIDLVKSALALEFPCRK